MKKSTSPLLVGTALGTASCFAKNILTSYLIKKDIISYDAVDKAAGLIITPYKQRDRQSRTVGWLADIVMGSTIATITATMHRKRIINSNPLTGVGVGLFCWTALFGGLGQRSSLTKTTPNDALVSAGWHAIFGAVMGGLLPLFLAQQKTEEELQFEQTDAVQKEYSIESPIR